MASEQELSKKDSDDGRYKVIIYLYSGRNNIGYKFTVKDLDRKNWLRRPIKQTHDLTEKLREISKGNPKDIKPRFTKEDPTMKSPSSLVLELNFERGTTTILTYTLPGLKLVDTEQI